MKSFKKRNTAESVDSLDQREASASVLAASQRVPFPYTISALGLEIIVRPGVFSPKHFHGWDIFTRNFPNVRGEHVLEVGCGTGVTAIYLAKNGAKRVVAVDISHEAVSNTQENVVLNHISNVEVRHSDVLSNVAANEKFHTIYWNLPFIFVPEGYRYRSTLERGLFDPGYRYTERFLVEAKKHLYEGGRVIVGLADFADLARFQGIVDRQGYTSRLIAKEQSEEINPVEFRLYELKPKIRVFYAMPFTGRSHDEILKFRQNLHAKAAKFDLELLEQFIGVEEEDKFEAHGYLPLFIARKDHGLLRMADIVMVDYGAHSVGRDCELVVAKEVMNKRVIAIVPDPHMRNHPYIRLYSNYIVPSVDHAFELAAALSLFSLPSDFQIFSREQKDAVDRQITALIERYGTAGVSELMPPELKRRWETLFAGEYQSLIEWSFRGMPKTVRTNTLKCSPKEFDSICKKYAWSASPVEGFEKVYRFPMVRPSVSFGETPEFAEGLFYVQDLASMLPALALEPKPGETVLDLGAAPGSKTTQMAAMMQNNGRIVALDISGSRVEVLKSVVKRVGATIVEPRLADATALGDEYSQQFDKVLVDGPCSCEGIFRYKPHKLFEWDLLQIYRLTEILQKMLQSGFEALKPGGTLVYSTCTYAPEENEAIVSRLLQKYRSAEIISLQFSGVKTRSGLENWEHDEYDTRLSQSMRIYPQDNDTIGFFIAKITKFSNNRSA